MALLQTIGLHAYYGKSHILRGVDLQVNSGEIVCLLGRNGVGRSTALKAILGQVHAEGSVQFRGCEIRGLRPFKVVRQGLGYVPETRDVFPGLTVEENLALGVHAGRRTRRWSMDDMYALFPRLGERRSALAGVLSGGEQQMLTLCRSLMGDPDLVMIDEPTEGLAPRVVEEVGSYLESLRARGVAVLLVEQKLTIAMRIAQRVYVMGQGRIVYEGTPATLERDLSVRREWLEV